MIANTGAKAFLLQYRPLFDLWLITESKMRRLDTRCGIFYFCCFLLEWLGASHPISKPGKVAVEIGYVFGVRQMEAAVILARDKVRSFGEEARL